MDNISEKRDINGDAPPQSQMYQSPQPQMYQSPQNQPYQNYAINKPNQHIDIFNKLLNHNMAKECNLIFL